MQTILAVEQFLDSRAAHCSPLTIHWYGYMLNQFSDWCGERDISEITQADLYRFIVFMRTRQRADLRTGTLKNVTIAGVIRAIKALCNWCFQNGIIEGNPSVRLKSPVVNREPKALSQIQLNQITKVLTHGKWTMVKRDRALVLFLIGTGCRAGEILSLKLEQIHLDAGTCQVVGKGQKTRTIGMRPKTRRAMKAYIGNRTQGATFLSDTGTPLTRSGLREILRRLSKRVGFHMYPHALRHTYGTMFVASGGDPTHLQLLMGHAQVQTTNIYTDAARERAALKAQQIHAPV